MRRRRLIIVLLVLVLLTLASTSPLARSSDRTRSQHVEQQLSAALNQPVHIASASAAIYPRVAIKLGNVTIGDPVAVQVREIRIATGLRPLLSRIVDDAEVVVSDGSVRFR